MQFWTIIIILRIVYEIVRATTQVGEVPAVTETRITVRIVDPAAFAVRQEYTYRI